MSQATTKEPLTPQAFESLAERLRLPAFDILLVGDGSGNTVDEHCGWLAATYTKKQGVREFWGGANSGTNNYAELYPYVHAMWAIHTKTFGKEGRPSRPVRVVVVSDSEVTVKCGNKEYRRLSNGAVWAAMEWFEANGYQFHWHHVRRNSNPINARGDAVAGRVREVLEDFQMSQ